jgi:hypothetical protein
MGRFTALTGISLDSDPRLSHTWDYAANSNQHPGGCGNLRLAVTGCGRRAIYDHVSTGWDSGRKLPPLAYGKHHVASPGDIRSHSGRQTVSKPNSKLLKEISLPGSTAFVIEPRRDKAAGILRERLTQGHIV